MNGSLTKNDAVAVARAFAEHEIKTHELSAMLADLAAQHMALVPRNLLPGLMQKDENFISATNVANSAVAMRFLSEEVVRLRKLKAELELETALEDAKSINLDD